MNAPRHSALVRTRHLVKLRLAALARPDRCLAPAATPAISRPRTAAASTPCAAPARSPAFRPATGDITLFNPPGSTDAAAIDVTAAITDVRATCQDAGNDVVSTATFNVVAPAPRRRAGAAGRAALFRRRAAGRQQRRRQAGRPGRRSIPGRQPCTPRPRVQATVRVNRGAATLPENVRQILTRPRKAGEAEAAVDPLADPAVRDGGRQGDLRASGRLPADPGPAQVQRTR